MMKKEVGKYTGPGSVDVQNVKEELVDIKDGEMQGYMREKPDLAGVLKELESAMLTHGDKAGIHPSIYQGFTSKTALLTKIREHKLVVGKLHEVLCESEVYYEDARESDLIRVAKVIEDTAHHDNQPDLLAVFDKTLTYRSQYGEKAAATRRKNEEARAQPVKARETTPVEKPAESPRRRAATWQTQTSIKASVPAGDPIGSHRGRPQLRRSRVSYANQR